MAWVSVRGGWSVPTEAARRNGRLKFAEVQIADCAQRLGGRTVLKVVRQAFQPRRELNLRFHEAGGVVGARSRRDPARFVCTGCGHKASADTNAAVVILQWGLDKSLKPVEGYRKRPLKQEASGGRLNAGLQNPRPSGLGAGQRIRRITCGRRSRPRWSGAI